MTDVPPFVIEKVEPVLVVGPDALRGRELMSPYVWRIGDGRLGMLVRAVAGEGGPSTGEIWYGEGDDGLRFTMLAEPVLAPDGGDLDREGCEDPTVVIRDDEVFVFYTGVDGRGDGHLLWASGSDVRALRKRGVAIDFAPRQDKIKEAEVIVRAGHWTMGHEYGDEGGSNIGLAEGDGPSGPRRETRHGFAARAGHFDNWHLSPGPMLLDDPEHPVMFYNGGMRDARWGIGWVRFDDPNTTVMDQCSEPLVPSPGEEDGRDIAFAASLLQEDDKVLLYFPTMIAHCTARRSADPMRTRAPS